MIADLLTLALLLGVVVLVTICGYDTATDRRGSHKNSHPRGLVRRSAVDVVNDWPMT
ncbi:hypothetical protein JDM601_1351 [Mycolicibacter sinensis]|uniref:Uncharacterized protein n=1 Tax=Mycolicibacter sinensis (strain JDM601) TaxID=875328 RepID=F5YX82_MYCSD|nr:hypothetical protein [Mycolicibacter sinensis]AEF35351.1 hypothetical protein JDM601_1351 [Mycolicibacter sinensis]